VLVWFCITLTTFCVKYSYVRQSYAGNTIGFIFRTGCILVMSRSQLFTLLLIWALINRLMFRPHIDKIVSKAALRAKLILKCFQSRNVNLLLLDLS